MERPISRAEERGHADEADAAACAPTWQEKFSVSTVVRVIRQFSVPHTLPHKVPHTLTRSLTGSLTGSLTRG